MPRPAVPLDAIRLPAVLFDADHRIVAANDLAAALAGRPLDGLSADDLAGIFEIRSPDGTPIPSGQLAAPRAFAGVESVDVPIAVTLPDGRRVEILATASPVRDGGAVTGALVVWRDVTARVEAEGALRESEEKFRALLGASPDITILLDPDGTILAINETAARAFGGSATDFVGACIWEVMPAEVVDFRRERFDEALRCGRSMRYEEARNGRWYDTVVAPVLSGTGEVSRIAVISRNITLQRQAKEALEEREKRLRSILDRSLDALYRRDMVAGENEYYSPAIEALSGFSVEECLAMSMDEIIARVHPDDRPAVASAKMRAAHGADEGTIDYRFLCRDGTYRWFSDRFRVSRDEDGRPVSWEGIIRDITDRKEAEETLKESQAKYRDLIETTLDFIWEMDADGRYTYCSPQMEALWGIRPEEMIGRTPFDLMPPDARERALAKFAAEANAPEGFSGLETVSFDGRGRLVSVEISGVPFFSGDGVHLGYRGVTRDITARRRTEEALRESEERLRLAQEGAGIGIWDRDAANDRVTVELGFLERYGLDPEKMRTLPDWVRRVHPEDLARFEALRLAALTSGAPLDLEFRVITPSGDVRWLQVRGRGVPDSDGNLARVLGVIVDMTDRKRAEEALTESEADARAFFENMVDPCAVCELVVDARGEPVDLRLVGVNPALAAALSLPAGLIVGQTAFMILPTLHRQWLDLFLDVSRQQTIIQVEEPFPALGRRYHVTGFPVRNGRVAVVFRDITGSGEAGEERPDG